MYIKAPKEHTKALTYLVVVMTSCDLCAHKVGSAGTSTVHSEVHHACCIHSCSHVQEPDARVVRAEDTCSMIQQGSLQMHKIGLLLKLDLW